MEWLPTGLLASAGPWVALVSVTLSMLLGLFVAIKSGTLVTATQVDKIVAAYERMLALKDEEAVRREAALAAEIARNDRQGQQLERLLGYSQLGTEALVAVKRAATEAGGSDVVE